jgi:hypothetical protein
MFRQFFTTEIFFQTAAKCFGKQNVSLFQGKVNILVGRQCINIEAKQYKTRRSECNRGQLESGELIYANKQNRSTIRICVWKVLYTACVEYSVKVDLKRVLI